MLELRDTHNEVAGCLIAKLHESDAVQGGRAAVSAARRDITEGGIAAPNPMRDSVDDALRLATSAGDAASPITNSLKQVSEDKSHSRFHRQQG